jgi:MYXO-CTERM domain-containing protein
VAPPCAAAFAILALAPTEAAAEPSLAVPCDVEPLRCAIAPIGFDYTDSLPIEWSFDTGWVPPGSPLQVHLLAAVYAHTRVSLLGDLQTAWPEPLTLTTPGRENGGTIAYHYGVEVAAQASVTISALGQSFSWTGDIPYVPQVDFQVDAAQQFKSWGFAPGATASSTSELMPLAQVGLSDIIGASIPGVDGGFELDAAVELAATYVNDRNVIQTTDGALVTGGLITSEDGKTSTEVPKAPFVELDVHPEGHVTYEGTIHLVPAIWVSALGQNLSIPIADIPIGFPIASVDWVFEPVRVHVPLPDVFVVDEEIDFGDVAIGDEKVLPAAMQNDGEALAHAVLASMDPLAFSLVEAELDVPAASLAEASVRFAPSHPGPFEAVVMVESNDPDQPTASFLVRGNGVGGPPIVWQLDSDEGGATGGLLTEEAGCACEAAGAPDARGLWPALGLGAAALAVGARRRRRAR